MLRWMRGKILKDPIFNNTIQAQLNMVSVKEKMKEYKLCWWGHVQRRHSEVIFRIYIKLFYYYIKRGRGRPKKISFETIKKDMEELELSNYITYDKTKGKERIRIPDLNSLRACK